MKLSVEQTLEDIWLSLFIRKPRDKALIISARNMNRAERKRYGKK